jgi:hypothetical protein
MFELNPFAVVANQNHIYIIEMKMSPIFMFMILLFGLFVLLRFTDTLKEPYIDRYCNERGNCHACMKTAGCAWCPLANKCKLASAIKSDENCNPDNAITDRSDCKRSEDDSVEETYDEVPSEHAKSKPPAVYVTSETDYSHQTVMGDVSKLRGDVEKLQQQLPDLIASTVEKTLKSQPAPYKRI